MSKKNRLKTTHKMDRENESEENQSKNGIIRLIIVLLSIVIIGLLFLIFSKSNSSDSNSSNSSSTSYADASASQATPANNVTTEDGKQIITIDVKGGYNPKVSSAKAGVPTVLRFKTNGAFGCASSIYLPSMSYRTNLPLSGNTDIPLPTQKAGVFRGMCGMGMYNFIINFQ